MKKSTYIDYATILAAMSNRKQRKMMKEVLPAQVVAGLNDDEGNGLAAAAATIEMLRAKRA
jgi:hypothetical protein